MHLNIVLLLAGPSICWQYLQQLLYGDQKKVIAMDTPPKAEKCGPFIRYVLDELNCNVDLHDEEKIEDQEDLRKFSGHQGGLYLLYMKPDPQSELRYPVYIGVTKQSFKERFQRHARHGVIHEVWKAHFPKNLCGLGLYACCTHYQGSAAKKIKSIFRETFDFALKTGRDMIDASETYPSEWTKNNLVFPWDELKQIADEEDKQEEERKKSMIPAEKGGHFIRFLLDELNCNIHLYDREEIRDVEDVQKFPAHYGGLYLFYMKPEPESDLRYPIYVGVAKQSFRQRFLRQTEDRFNGILHKIWSGEFKGMGVYAVCTHHQGHAARTIKKLLLDSFDFPLKRNRGGSLRRELDTSEQLPAEYVKDNFNISWEECLKTVAATA